MPFFFKTPLLFLLALGIGTAPLQKCTKSNSHPIAETGSFARGADISWLTEMEAAGKKFYDKSGKEADCFNVLQSLGMNTIRLRVWVNPTDGWNGKADVVAKAVRARNAGMRLLIDFHYSDSWADPGKQTKPAAWQANNVNILADSIYTHTVTVLQALKSAGVSPEWVQVGNETNDGLLWPEGKASFSMANYARLVNAGYDAVKNIFPSSKVIVHLSNGYDNSLYRWNIGGLIDNGGRFDIIGMSLYPTAANWPPLNQQCLQNMQDMIGRYNKPVMVVEVGMPWDEPLACKSFLADIISKTISLPGHNGLGVLYWEPQSYGQWKGYTLGAFDMSGKPTEALDAFIPQP